MFKYVLFPFRKFGGLLLEAVIMLTFVFVLGGFWLSVYGESGLAFVAWFLSMGVAGKLYRAAMK